MSRSRRPVPTFSLERFGIPSRGAGSIATRHDQTPNPLPSSKSVSQTLRRVETEQNKRNSDQAERAQLPSYDLTQIDHPMQPTSDTNVQSILSMISSTAQENSQMENELRQREQRQVNLKQRMKTLTDKIQQYKLQEEGYIAKEKEQEGAIRAKTRRIEDLVKEQHVMHENCQSLKRKIEEMNKCMMKERTEFFNTISEHKIYLTKLLTAFNIKEGQTGSVPTDSADKSSASDVNMEKTPVIDTSASPAMREASVGPDPQTEISRLKTLYDVVTAENAELKHNYENINQELEATKVELEKMSAYADSIEAIANTEKQNSDTRISSLEKQLEQLKQANIATGKPSQDTIKNAAVATHDTVIGSAKKKETEQAKQTVHVNDLRVDAIV